MKRDWIKICGAILVAFMLLAYMGFIWFLIALSVILIAS